LSRAIVVGSFVAGRQKTSRILSVGDSTAEIGALIIEFPGRQRAVGDA
jgi:hypothetical protein